MRAAVLARLKRVCEGMEQESFEALVVQIADSPEQAIDRLRHGDVLIVPCTTPAYNAVLTLAAAVVTADGGPLSHAAVLARELGISAVVGARGALTEIPDGALIDVDPVVGEVRVVAEP